MWDLAPNFDNQMELSDCNIHILISIIIYLKIWAYLIYPHFMVEHISDIWHYGKQT